MGAKHLSPLYNCTSLYYPVQLSSFSVTKNDTLESDLLQVSTMNTHIETSNPAIQPNFMQLNSVVDNFSQISDNVQLNSGIHICIGGPRYIHPSCIPMPFDIPKSDSRATVKKTSKSKPKIEHFVFSGSIIQKRKRKEKLINRVCYHCGNKETTHWRCGPNGKNTLCNACGLQYSKVLRKPNQTDKGKIASLIN